MHTTLRPHYLCSVPLDNQSAPGTMTKRYAFLPLIFGALCAQAQAPIELRDYNGDLVNGQLVVFTGDANESVFEKGVTATLSSGPMRVINVRRYEVDVQPNTQNYFCWGVCYGPQDAGSLPVWSAFGQHALELEPGVAVTNFKAYHSPFGLVGNSTYRYVWFDTAQPTDSVWCDIQFRAIDNVGVDELRPAATLGVFPNPSRGGDIQFSLELSNVDQALDLVVFNALGERLRTLTVRPGQLNARLGTDALAEGLYFASLMQGGTTLATQRFVVSRR